MFDSELNNVCILVLFCFIFLLAHAVWRKIKLCKTTLLPTTRRNSVLIYIRWVWHHLKSNSLYNDSKIILKVTSSVAHRYRKVGMVYFGIPFLNIVFLFHPNTIQPLLQSPSNIDKSIFYKFFEKWLGTSLFLSNGKKFHKRRKVLIPAFHLKNMDKFLPIIEDQSKILVETLAHSAENEAIDIVPLITSCVLNIICETAMGLPARVSHGDYATYWQQLNILLNVIQERMYTVWRWPDIIFGLTRSGREFKECIDRLNVLTDQIIEERILQMKNEDKNSICREPKYQNRKNLAFLDILLNSSDSDYTSLDIKREVQFFLFAGHDTSNLTLIYTLYLLGKHPDIQSKVQEEVDAVVGNDPQRPITKDDLSNLKYTECVIKETLRLYPTVPLISRKTSEDIKIGDYNIPKGVNCVISIIDLHQNPDIFPNPNVFDPERFFPENCIGRHPYAFIPFSAGLRNCMGQKMAMLEIKMIIAKIMQKLTLTSLDTTLEVGYNVLLRPKGPVRLQMKQRYKYNNN